MGAGGESVAEQRPWCDRVGRERERAWARERERERDGEGGGARCVRCLENSHPSSYKL